MATVLEFKPTKKRMKMETLEAQWKYAAHTGYCPKCGKNISHITRCRRCGRREIICESCGLAIARD